MHTRISRIADKVLEAIVLAAVLAIPLFFNSYSARVFVGEKVSLLRALAALAVVAWVIRLLETRNWKPRSALSSWREQPVMLAALAIGLATAVAGLVSITSRLSLWGSYQRGQGIITTLCYLTLFATTIGVFDKPNRRRRLVTTLLVASGPAALVAIVQFAGLNPVPLRSIDPSRMFGTLSNPIFLGAYLTLVLPLTLAQIARLGFASESVPWRGILAYTMLLLLQLTAVAVSGSRGPLLGIVAGGLLFVLLLALSRRRGVAVGVLLAVVLGLAFLVGLNLPNTPLTPLQNVLVLGRFGQIAESGSARVRVLIWQGVADRFAGARARLAFGFGPESTHAALLSTYPAELRHLEPERLPDRAHNVFMEALVTTGVVGAASVLFLFGSVFYTGLRAFGWVSDTRSRNQWLALTVVGVALGVLLPPLMAGSWTFSGLGAGVGLAAGLGAYLLRRLWRPEPAAAGTLTDRQILVAGVLAALAGHLIEITVGIRVTPTQTVFWVLAGLLVVLSAAREERPAQTPTPSSTAGDGVTLVWDSEVAALGLLGGLMLSTLAFGVFLLPGTGARASAAGRWMVLIGAWLLAGAVWLRAPGRASRPGTGWIYPAISAVWAGFFIVLRSLLPLLGRDALTLLNVYFVWLLISLAGVALLLPRPASRAETTPAWKALVHAALVAGALGIVAWIAVKPLYADIYLKAADAHASAGQWPQALAFYQQAANEEPEVDVYQQHMGEAYATAARLAQDPDQRDALFQTGERALRRAVELNPAEGTHLFNLAHLYLLWGQTTGDRGRQTTLFRQAASLYERAASKMPSDTRVLTEWGQVFQFQGDADAALAKYREALERDPADAQAYLQAGLLYHQRGKTEPALEMYQQAIEVDPERADAYRAMADLYRQSGRLMDAVTAQERAAQLQPTDYAIHQNLALLYRDLGQIEQAVGEAKLALSYAPPEKQAALQSFVQSLLALQPTP
ncbi:MAG: TPR repeat-containing protein YrrB [Anaerolineales bacterium]|nr:TPR repeat-containing protein YrrB [Anaerolineales bacterium]